MAAVGRSRQKPVRAAAAPAADVTLEAAMVSLGEPEPAGQWVPQLWLKMLYRESILLTLSPCDTTHYDDIKSVHYHQEEEEGDLSS